MVEDVSLGLMKAEFPKEVNLNPVIVAAVANACSEDRFAGPHSSASSRRSAATWARPTGSSAPPVRTSQ